MRNVKPWLRVFLITSLACLSSCKSAPLIEWCIVGDAGLICIDPRLDEGKREYERTFKEAVNYIATNPNDLKTLMEYCDKRSDP